MLKVRNALSTLSVGSVTTKASTPPDNRGQCEQCCDDSCRKILRACLMSVAVTTMAGFTIYYVIIVLKQRSLSSSPLSFDALPVFRGDSKQLLT